MDAWRNDNVGTAPANVDARAGMFRGRVHLRIIGPLVNEGVTTRGDDAQALRGCPVFILQPLHCGGIVHIDSEETGLRTGNRAPVAIGELTRPRFNLCEIGRGAVGLAVQDSRL
jgi:hypothetical protein